MTANQEQQSPVEATIDVDLRHPRGDVDREIYGHFLESNFFRNIEGGVLDEGHPQALPGPGPQQGLRADVIEACRTLGVPVVRWPGGNFTSPYHWPDGIGPRDRRPRRLELTWGGEESNRFGTDEFLAWCELVGAEPFLVHSCRDVDEAVRWVEYTNYGGDTEMTRARAANGHPEPYRVRYWGVGNEVYGPWQMGHRSAEAHAWAARDHARFMRAVDPSLKLVGVGIPWDAEEWTRPLIARAGEFLDYISLHLYGASTHLFTAGKGEDDYDEVVAQSVWVEQRLASYGAMVHDLATEYAVDRPLALAFDEWTMRHLEPQSWPEPEAGDDGGVADRDLPVVDPDAPGPLRVNRYSTRTLADALFYAGVFHGMHRLVDAPVAPRLANTVNLVNANAPLIVRNGGVVQAPTYHVWDLYQNHTGPVALPATVSGPARTAAVRQGDSREGSDRATFKTGLQTVASLDVSASTDHDRSALHVAVINRERSRSITARVVSDGVAGTLPRRARVRDLGAGVEDVLATNSLTQPDRVALTDRGDVELADGTYCFPPHSVTLLTFRL